MKANNGEKFMSDLERKLREAKSQRVEITDVRSVPPQMKDYVSSAFLKGNRVYWDPENEMYIQILAKPN